MFNLQDLQDLNKAIVDLRFIQAASIVAVDSNNKHVIATHNAYMNNLGRLQSMLKSEIARINKLK